MPEVVVVGGGYGGVQAARELDRRLSDAWSITLLDRDGYHQLVTRLPEVFGGRLPAEKACLPLARLLRRRVRLVRDDVRAIDPGDRRIVTEKTEYHYDGLVVAAGSTQDFLDVPGAAEYGSALRTVEDARTLRDRLLELLASQSTVRAAVVGAGYTGTEMAGELAEWPGMGRSRPPVSVTVVEEDPRLLPQGNERLAAVAERVLRRNGVAFSLGTPVQRIAPDHLDLGAAGIVACDLVLWAVRKRGSPIVARPGWALAPDGRARVDPYLRALGHERVYVVGDAAAAYNYERDAPVQSSAQLAVQEGALAGRNLAADLLGGRREEFRARVLGEALSLGGRNGAAELAGLVLTGRAALAIKEAALIRYLTRLGGPGLAGQYA